MATLDTGCSIAHQTWRTKHSTAISPKRAAMQFAIPTHSCNVTPLSLTPLGLARDFPEVPRDIHTWSEQGSPHHSNDPNFSLKTY